MQNRTVAAANTLFGFEPKFRKASSCSESRIDRSDLLNGLRDAGPGANVCIGFADSRQVSDSFINGVAAVQKRFVVR